MEYYVVKADSIPAPCPNTCVEKNRESVGVDGSQVYVLVNPSAELIVKSG